MHKRAIITWIICALEKSIYGLKDYLRIEKNIYVFKKNIYSFEVISAE